MKLTLAFLQLVRWPNLLFIIITQLLFYYCIILPLLPPDYFQSPYALHAWVLYLLIAASIPIPTFPVLVIIMPGKAVPPP